MAEESYEECYTIRFKPIKAGWAVQVERSIHSTPPEVYLGALQTVLAVEQQALSEHLDIMQERCRKN